MLGQYVSVKTTAPTSTSIIAHKSRPKKYKIMLEPVPASRHATTRSAPPKCRCEDTDWQSMTKKRTSPGWKIILKTQSPGTPQRTATTPRTITVLKPSDCERERWAWIAARCTWANIPSVHEQTSGSNFGRGTSSGRVAGHPYFLWFFLHTLDRNNPKESRVSRASSGTAIIPWLANFAALSTEIASMKMSAGFAVEGNETPNFV
mmetsp:Transcript_2504/g.5958  ORF Transcript_2504/g.5958 Transcript_2504/m.5958 type:complete len:205 (-) Transcript_2504:1266-1880(-)